MAQPKLYPIFHMAEHKRSNTPPAFSQKHSVEDPHGKLNQSPPFSKQHAIEAPFVPNHQPPAFDQSFSKLDPFTDKDGDVIMKQAKSATKQEIAWARKKFGFKTW